MSEEEDTQSEQEQWTDPGRHLTDLDPENEEDEEQEAAGEEEPGDETPFLFYVLQSFLIPVIIIGAVLLMFLGVRWLFSGGRTVKELKRSITNGTERERWQAATDLVKRIGRNEKTLKKFRKDERFKAWALRVFRNTHSNEEKLLAYMARTLGMLAYDRAIPELRSRLQSSGSDVVKIAVLQAMGDIGSKDSLDVIVPLTRAENNSDPGIRQAAVYALGQLNSEKIVPPLEEALSDRVAHVRLNAAIGLANYSDRSEIPREKVVNVLRKMLDREAVRQMKQPDANGNMKEMKPRDVERIMIGAMKAVRSLKHRDFLDTIRTIHDSDESSWALRKEARKTISTLKSQS